jgi:hypothetical protein
MRLNISFAELDTTDHAPDELVTWDTARAPTSHEMNLRDTCVGRSLVAQRFTAAISVALNAGF